MIRATQTDPENYFWTDSSFQHLAFEKQIFQNGESEPREDCCRSLGSLRLYELARRGDVDQALEIGKLITENPTQVPLVKALVDVVTARAAIRLCIEHIEREQSEPRKESNKSANAFDSCIRLPEKRPFIERGKGQSKHGPFAQKEEIFGRFVHRNRFLLSLERLEPTLKAFLQRPFHARSEAISRAWQRMLPLLRDRRIR